MSTPCLVHHMQAELVDFQVLPGHSQNTSDEHKCVGLSVLRALRWTLSVWAAGQGGPAALVVQCLGTLAVQTSPMGKCSRQVISGAAGPVVGPLRVASHSPQHAMLPRNMSAYL